MKDNPAESEMLTAADNVILTEEEKLVRLKNAKGGTWYDGWRPYCIVTHCHSGDRMLQRPYGFHCPTCGNMIGWDCNRILESPLNARQKGAR